MYKKIILSGAVIGGFVFYAIQQKLFLNKSETDIVKSGMPPIPVNTEESFNIPIPKPAGTSTGTYRDGIYTGRVSDAFYGPMQVKIEVTGGKLTDVQFIQFPNDRQTSVEINKLAMPLLKKEAIEAQSSKVEGITGATQTSIAFIESLDSALNQAK